MTLLNPTIDTLDSDDAGLLLKVSVPSISLRVSLASLLLSGVLGADLQGRLSRIGNTGVFFSLRCHFLISKRILRVGWPSSSHVIKPTIRGSALPVLLRAGLNVNISL